MARTKQTLQQAPPTLDESPLPDWLVEAHRHFYQTGFYRPEDVQRVIGSQREGVEVRVEAGWGNASFLSGEKD